MRSFAIFALAFLVTFSGCHCGKKTDEEILLERIDTTSVHLYLATKVAIIKSESSPEAAEAKKQLIAALEVIGRMAAAHNPRSQPSASGSPAAPPSTASSSAAPPSGSTIPASVTSGSPSAGAAPEAPKVEISAADLAKLATALWGLKKEGQALVKGRHEDDLPPVLPLLLGAEFSPEIRDLYDTNTEHGLFLLTLFALKFHQKNPVPVPPEILLYEAWMARSEGIKVPGMSLPVRAIKSVVYSQNELCDLGAAEGDGLDKEAGALTPAIMNTSFKTFGAASPSVTDEQTRVLSASARAIAHGATAICYFNRKEKPKALDSLEKFVKAAHEAGVPPGETALLRAYLAYEKQDYETAKSCLEEAKNDPSVDAETRAQIETLTADFTKKDDAAISKFFNGSYFDVLCVKLIFLRVERSGVFNDVVETKPIQTARGYLFAATEMLASAKDSVSIEGAKKKGSELLDGLKR